MKNFTHKKLHLLRGLFFALLMLSACLGYCQVSLPGGPGIPIGIGGPGVVLPINILSGYPNPYANKAPAYRSVYLFRASELPALAGKPQAIRTIFFDDSIPQKALLHNYTIRMKQVTWDEMPDSIPDEGLQVVYSPRTYVDKEGLNEHILDVPFCWDGVSNFIVDICVQNPPNEKSNNASIRITVPDSAKKSSYHDWNMTGAPICMAADQAQDDSLLFIQRPVTYFAVIHGDSADLRIHSVSSPAELLDVNTLHQVSFRFQNYSCPALTGVKLGYKWNNNPPVIENYPGSINPGQYVNYTFTTPLQAAPAQFSILKIWTQHPDDKYPVNDTITLLIFVKDGSFDGLDYTGKEFWIAFMQNFNNQDLEQKIFLTSTNNASVQVSAPLLGWSQNVTLVPNTIKTVDIPAGIANTIATTLADTINPTGIFISSDQDISVYAYSGINLSGDAYLAIPRRTLGRNYMVTAPIGIYNRIEIDNTLINAPAEFIVVCTENNTSVEIIPSVPTAKYNKGDTIRVTLNKGQTFLVKARIDRDSIGPSGTYDLTGTYVMSDKKIGLIGGSQCALVPGINDPANCSSCDHLLEMLTPPSTWGNTFYATDFAVKPGKDIFRVINADTAKVAVNINGSSDTIPPRLFKDFKLMGEVHIEAAKPIQVLQMCTGGYCDTPMTSSDPFITSLIPEAQWGNYYTFATPITKNLSLHYINIIKKSAAGRTAIDGVLIPPGYYKPIAGTGYFAAKLKVDPGVHKVSGDSILCVNVYGFGKDNSYGYPASGSFLKIINLPEVKIEGSATNVTCYNAKNGRIEVKGLEGTPPYGFYWNDGETGPVRDSLTPGNYWVFVEDDYGYQDTAYFTITEPTALTLDVSGTSLTCFQSGDGTAQAVAGGGTLPHKYIWNDGVTLAQRSSLPAGTYVVTVSDSNNCLIRDSVKVTQPNPIKIVFSEDMPDCKGGADGKIMATVSGGNGKYTYTWQDFPGNNTNTIDQVGAGNYPLHIADSLMCMFDTVAVMREPDSLKVILDVTNMGCFNASSGSIAAKGTGGYGSYTYTWNTSPEQYTSKITGLSKGMYTVTVKDGYCSYTDSALIDSVASPVYEITTNLATCDLANGSAGIKGTGGTGNYTFVWKTSPFQTGANAYNLKAGNYEVYTSDGVCNITLPFTIPGIPAPRFDLATTMASCGQQNGSASVSNIVANGNYSITWRTNPLQYSTAISNLKAGSYSVAVKDSLCEAVQSFVITKLTEIKVVKVDKVLPDCGQSNGSIKLSLSGGADVLRVNWLTDPPRSGSFISGLAAGTYGAEITDGLCTLKVNVSLANKGAPKIAFQVTHPKCGDANGQIKATVTGGAGPFKLTWNNDTSLNQYQLNDLLPGTYSLIVTAGACVAGLDTTLSDQPAPDVSLIPEHARCGLNNGTVTAQISGGTGNNQITWNGAPGGTVLSSLGEGKYVISVNDGRCIVKDSAYIMSIIPPGLTPAVIDSSWCGLPNGVGRVTASGGSGFTDITWKTSPVQYGDSATGLPAGSYWVTVTDVYCIDSILVTIPERLLPVANVSLTPEHCDLKDGVINVDTTYGNAPFSITWKNLPDTGFTLRNRVSGWYTFTLYDKYCQITDSVFLPAQAGPVIALDNIVPAHCGLNNGEATVNIISANEPYVLEWTTNPVQTQQQATGLAPGDYLIKIIGQYCRDSLPFSITRIPDLFYKTDSVIDATCNLNNGKVVISAAGGQGVHNYSWKTDPMNKTNTLSGITPGWVVYSVSDDYCNYTDSVEIKAITPPFLASIETGKDWCRKNNGFIKVTPQAGNGNYTYIWQGIPNASGDSVGNLGAGNYTLVLSDGSCTNTYNFTIDPGYPPFGTVQVIRDEICGRADGAARVDNLTPGSTVLWNTGITTASIGGLAAGNYFVRLSNAECDTNINFSIGHINAPELGVTALSDTCNSGRGSIAYGANQGNPPYSYKWDDTPITGSGKLASLEEGRYMLTVTDINQCADTHYVDIDNFDPPMPPALIIFDPAEPSTVQGIEITSRLPVGWKPDHWAVNGVEYGSGGNTLSYPPTYKESSLTFTLYARYYAGCLDSIEAVLAVKDDYTIYIPNSFTPDGDGYNENFRPITSGITSISGSIYDRWGEPVFTFTSLDEHWDGTYNGKKLKTDTYAFKLNFITKKGEQVSHTGKITLLR